MLLYSWPCSYCNPADYELSKTEEREIWTVCCDDAKKANIKDPDCEKPQW
jgi:hypothetical protein